jgi:hypothetical protein
VASAEPETPSISTVRQVWLHHVRRGCCDGEKGTSAG